MTSTPSEFHCVHLNMLHLLNMISENMSSGTLGSWQGMDVPELILCKLELGPPTHAPKQEVHFPGLAVRSTKAPERKRADTAISCKGFAFLGSLATELQCYRHTVPDHQLLKMLCFSTKELSCSTSTRLHQAVKYGFCLVRLILLG